jgi:hypothetical protein
VYGLVGTVAALAVGAVLGVHLLLAWRRGRVFVSFHHEREGIADKLTAAMGNAGLRCLKLPFVGGPEHDALLDNVRSAIRECDVFVCVPGDRASFVEHEVSMAFGLARPLVFVVVAGDTPRLPNTAKKGYPVFVLEQLESEGISAMVKFCSYLARDWRSTLRLYAAVLSHTQKCLILLVPIYFVSLLVGLTFGASMTPEAQFAVFLGQPIIPWIMAMMSNPSVACFGVSSLLLFLLPYTAYFLTRALTRKRVRHAVSNQRFTDVFLPETLDYSLARADLLAVLFNGQLIARHEEPISSVR